MLWGSAGPYEVLSQQSWAVEALGLAKGTERKRSLNKGREEPVLEKQRRQEMGVTGALVKMVPVEGSAGVDGLLEP